VRVEYRYSSTPLSTCTIQLYLYSPQCLYSTAISLLPSVPVQYSYTPTTPQCLYSTAITLLPSVPVEYSYTSTPSVPVQYSYTSTPLRACKVQLYLYSPQYLYSTAIPVLPSISVQYSYTSTPLSTSIL